MNIYGYHYENIRPLSGTYVDDKDVSLKSHKIVTAEGLDSYFVEALSGGQDVSYNNYNQFWLTEKKDRSQICEHKISISQYPIYKTTYMKASGADKFLVVNGSTGTCEMTGTSANIDNRYYLELEFVNEDHCYVKNFNSNTVKYLTLTTGNSGNLTFTSRASSEERKTDSQIFEYMLDETNGTLTLFTHVSTQSDASIPLLIQNHQSISNNISAVALPTSTTFVNSGNKFYIKPKTIYTPTSYDVGMNWVQYKSTVQNNTNDIDLTNSQTNVKNNYILHTSTNTLDYASHSLDCKLLPLKTLLTPEGTNNDTNPYSGEPDNNHRDYSKLFTGGNEENGHESIYANYQAGIKELTFETDKLTYFRAPQVMSPYEKANINDLSLHQCGSIAGNTPVKSDKLFKQLETSRNNRDNKLSPENTELRGTWLCSWLSGNSNPASTPVWVDRYYNPDFYTRASAFTAGMLTPVQYVDNFSYITQKIGASASHITIYDKLSDLTIEPGGLYAYYHGGPGNSQKIIDSLNDNLAATDLSEYQEVGNINRDVGYDYDGPMHTMPNGVLHTGHSHSSKSYEVPKLYNFRGDTYGATDSVSTQGSFTTMFWLYNTDWSIPFGNQIIGNYKTEGFGFYNKDYVAPFIMIPSLSSIDVFNSDFTFIDTYNLERRIKGFVRKGNLENFWIIDDNNTIYEYSINGTIKNVITSTHLNSVTVSDIDVRGTTLYILIAPNMSSSTASYVEYDMTNTSSSYQGTAKTDTIWNYGTGVSVNSSSSIHPVAVGLSAAKGVVITVHDSLSARTSDTHGVSGSVVLGSTSFADNSGSPWTVQNGKVYTYDRSTSSNIAALSSTKIIEGIACDTGNNVWALHDLNKLSKLNNDRKLLFTNTLSSLSSTTETISARVVYNRYIDFIVEFDSTGKSVESCITINQSVSGCKCIKVSTDGSTSSTLNVLSGHSTLAKPVTFFNTPSQYWKTITGHHYIRQHARDDNQQVKAKIKVSRDYNTTTTPETLNEYSLTYNVSALKPGWNHFAIKLDAEKGTYGMYINTSLVDSTTVPQGAYSKAGILTGPMTIGATPFYTKSYLFDHLQQPGHHICSNISIKGLKIYNTAIDYYDIKAHYDIYNIVMPVRWNMPTGQRSYMDTIERVFNFRVPGRKSEMFNLNIYNTLLTDIPLKTDLQAIIEDNIYDIIPAYSKLRDVKWDGVTLSAASATAGNITTTNINQPNFAGDVYIEGGDYSYD